MQFWSSFSTLKEDFADKVTSGLVVTVGNFDGVHRGHQQIIQRVKAIGNEYGWFSLIVTFQEHTSLTLSHQSTPLLMSLEEKCKYLKRLGLDGCLALDFTPEIAQLTAEQFLEQLVRVGTKALIVGHDFTFGAGGVGDTRFLLAYAQKNNLYGEVVPPVKYQGKIVSSSKIRSLLTAGRLAEANGMLNRPFSIYGQVQHGEGRGKRLGFPTANISVPEYRLLPKYGVYFVRVLLEGKDYYGLANVGCKPTFNHSRPLLEVYIFDFSAEIYDRFLTVEFLEFLRIEQKFTSPQALQVQMLRDKKRGEELMAVWRAK
ncbi:MAG: bifunctional riboflavin kinase/FAD synthetase [Firmicutes bacterium]|nr:bifunctional riboflavin kinase/FAD synthetase [Bacillota bacterium]